MQDASAGVRKNGIGPVWIIGLMLLIGSGLVILELTQHLGEVRGGETETRLETWKSTSVAGAHSLPWGWA